ncbi:hypothetical protein GCM10008995_23140 [Halobellus salinus]|uniref:DNA helicase n=1 Tax=Halobellus salinus TaxID=931585 RepID=A0A830EQU4_9EURY|nr:LAGLIDADG family homing endonuclease [Halobellus salinus]GGJ12656.1 hypothetical protein GCM10008995_23140 [Halobellus salinus]SMP28826.1 intein C-terminal splicing region/intein N-terminal splicing region [Halobellus salinus]
MAQAPQDPSDVTDRFIQFYRKYYRNEIGTLAQNYPNEQRSLYVDYDDLSTFDIELAEDYAAKPDQMQEYAEEALRLYDLPADVKLGRAHVRLTNLPETVDIRNIRVHDDHIGRMIAVQGIVRKATDVRPKITEAAFECQRCGTMTYIPQSDSGFQEPHECQGCERQGPFHVDFDQSEFVDAQKVRVQESPEGLRGGETPQNIDVDLEDDVTGRVTAGDHVTLTGVLHIEQQTSNNEKTPIFDLYMDGVAVEIEDEEFEDMNITEEDVAEIVDLSNESDIHEMMVDSVAPSIYGYREEKLAMILQLFSGVTKHLPDGSRIRGDLHMLLIGDPGTGKCVAGDTLVTLADGSEVPIRELVEENLDDPKPVDDGVWDTVDFDVPSMESDGSLTTQRATKVWKREAPDELYRIRTASGREIEATPSHPLFVADGGGFDAVVADKLKRGQSIAAPGSTIQRTRPEAATSDPTKAATDGGVSTDRIVSIEAYQPDDEWVYDLEIAGTHSYLTNGIVSHNSAMLQYIRNIAPRSVYTSGKGSSSAGLCVTGDTRIHTSEGFVPIRDLAMQRHPDPVSTETPAAYEQGLYTFDREDGTVDAATSSRVWRMPEKPCRRIETGRGKTLEASANTPVLTCGEDGIEWKPVREVSAGDYVAAPKYDGIDRSAVPTDEFIDYTEEKLRLTDESIEFLREQLTETYGTLRDAAAALNFPEDFIYDTLSNRYIPIEKLDRILDAVGASHGDVTVRRAMLAHGDDIRIPQQFDEDLLYLVGLVFGDGDIALDRRDGNRGLVRISNSNEALLERAAKIIDSVFDKRVEIERQEDRVPCIRFHSGTIARFFSNLGMESPKDSLELDPRLTTAEHADAFLRGLMDADGSVSSRTNGGSSVQFSTISESLAEQVQLVFETYGIESRRRVRDRRGTTTVASGYTIESKSVQHHLAIYGRNIDRYAEVVGFESSEKQAALSTIVGATDRRDETIPIGGALATAEVGGGGGQYYMNVTRGDNPGRARAHEILDSLDLGDVQPALREAADADLTWDEVVETVDTGEKEVFDLTVPGTHNFLGNGLVTHNTAAAVRDDFGDGQQWTLEAGALVLADKGIAAVDELDKMRCVTGDTLVHTADGIRPIRELAYQAAEDGAIESLSNGRTIRGDAPDVWTLADDGTLVQRPVTAVHEYEAPTEVYQVTLESGESVKTTADHPFFVFEDGERTERAAEDLDSGDWAYVPEAVRERAADGGAIAEPAARNDTDRQAYDSDSDLSPSKGAILGYIAGDGNVYSNDSEGSYGIRFTNSEEQLLRHFESVCDAAYGAEAVRHPSEQRADGVGTVRLHGKVYVDDLLEAGLNLETYEGKRVPSEVTRSSRKTKAAFIRALADSEATVGKRAVKIYSSSYELLLGTKMLFSEFGIQSQIQTRSRSEKRDLYVLAITSDSSLAAYESYIGFTLDRKQSALEEATRRTTGDRALLDVLPDFGDQLERLRDQLRLYQSECGINDATYCNFENGDANPSLHRAEKIRRSFEERRRQASKDRERLVDSTGWTQLEVLCDEYHVSQRELARGSLYSQQQISRLWGNENALRTTIADRLQTILDGVAGTDLERLNGLIDGDVRWRKVESVEPVTSATSDTRIPVLERKLADLLGCSSENACDQADELLNKDLSATTWGELRDELDRHEVSFQRLAAELDVAGSTVSRWFSGSVDVDNFGTIRETAFDLLRSVRTTVARLRSEIETRRQEPKVYDLTVDGTHNFVANGMIVHNSEDRSAMHEALEQQSISVSKAGINATLKSRCSLLGAANPKYGRFDQYEPIGEQIDLEPALISRFDLIFTVTDSPDPETDAKLAEHIINTNYAGELHTQRTNVPNSEFTESEIDSVTAEVTPEIEAELLRKYIAYAKRTCYPTMTEEAKEVIRQFYVDFRAKGADEDAPVPVTARKLEALVRLSEASARLRLSDTVKREDAVRVTEIVESCLRDIGMDPETGEFDADIVETGTSKNQRDRIKDLKHLIEELEDEYDEGAPVSEVVSRAGEDLGLDESKAEQEIENLRRKGEVYEPRTDYLRTT